MEYLLHIKPTFNCLLKMPNQEQLLSKNRTHTFIVNNLNQIPVSFYPVDDENKNSLPFAAVFTKTNQTLKVDKKQITVINFPNNNYLVKVKPFLFCYPKTFEIKTKTLNFANLPHSITWLENEISPIRISNKESFFDIPLTTPITKLNFKTKNNFLLGYGKQDDNKYLVFLLKYENNSYKPCCILTADILEEDLNTITTYTKINDFAGHGQINTFEIENEIKQSTTLVYNFESPFIAKHKEFVPFAFFEAIKIKNYKLARVYLTNELSNKLTNTHLKTFFGEFLYTSQTLSPTFNHEEIALIYNNDTNYFAKIFNLKLNNQNKIEDIIEN